MEEKDIVSDGQNQTFARFAAAMRQVVSNLEKTTDSNTVSFSTFSKSDVLSLLKSPTSQNAQQRLRKASIQMFTGSNQYWRLIMFYALMPMWVYSITPKVYDPESDDGKNVRQQFYKTAAFVEKINLRHEMRKIMPTVFCEGVFYGCVWSNDSTWFLQKINPDYCKLSTVVDGTYLYAVDMSKIKEDELNMYPKEFTKMWNAYQTTGNKWQEVPEKISFCIKANEGLSYCVPPFASVLPSIYDLEAYKELAKTADEIANYKMVSMTAPTDKEGRLTMEFPRLAEFYETLCNALPPQVGAAISPTKLDAINFEKSGLARDTDEIESATRHFWYASGTSPLLFGDASNTSSSALSLSIRSSEEIVFSVMSQCERVLNRHIGYVGGKPRFKITIYPVTVFNFESWTKYLKESGSLGLPVKMAYNSLVGVESVDVSSMAFLENDVLKLTDIFKPLTSSYTQSAESSGEVGRPRLSDDQLSDEGEKTRDKG